MSTTTLDAALAYTRRGWRVIPIPARSKNPNRPGWQEERLDESDLPRLFSNGQNIGVLMGEPSGWLIDVDLDRPEALILADKFLPETAAIFGRPSAPGSHRLYTCETSTKKFNLPKAWDGGADKETVVEIRSTGAQTVFPGSVHPEGEPIIWFNAGVPTKIEAPSLLHSVQELYRASVELFAIKSALAGISPDCGYDDWIKIGMAIHAWDKDLGLRIWDEWSEQAKTKYAGFTKLDQHWRSFSTSGRIRLGTLFHIAEEAGWSRLPRLNYHVTQQVADENETSGAGDEDDQKSAPDDSPPKPSPSVLPPSIDVGAWYSEILTPPDPVIEGAFDLGTKAMVVGPSKARKSFFMLQLLLSLAAGLPSFLSWQISKPRRVLLLNLEIPPAHFQARIRRMMRALNITPEMLEGRFHVINARGIEPSLTLLPQIVERVREQNIEVVAADPIYKLIPGDESKQEEVKPLLRMFDQLANQTNVAVVYCHHSQKGIAGDRMAVDRASGTGVMARDFDWMASLCHHKDHKENGLLVCEQIARSYPPKDAFSLGWDDSGYFVASDAEPILMTTRNADKSGKRGPGLNEEDAYHLAVQKGPMLSNLFHAALRERGFTERGARNATDLLVEGGRLAKQNFGFPKRVYIGTPSEVAALIIKLKNPDLPGAAP